MRIPAARLLPRAVPRLPRIPRVLRVHWRRRLVALALLAAVLSAVYFLWFRDSALVRVHKVTVEGLSTAPDAPQLRARLTRTAREMTTLNVDAARLRHVVAGDPVVHSIEVRPDFPHGLLIHVVENRPVALLSAGGRSVPVAADGTLLEGVDVNGTLPTLSTPSLPDGRRVPSGGTLDRVTVAGAAPPALLARVESITIQPDRGFVVQLTDGPALWLGGADQLDLKWTAAAAVLAQSSSKGASYVDLRVPERPVAGGLDVTTDAQPDPGGPADVPTPGSTSATPTDPTATPAPTASTPTATSTPSTATPSTSTPSAAAPTTATPATPVTPAPTAPTTP
jgi:cell division protein FtsQ